MAGPFLLQKKKWREDTNGTKSASNAVSQISDRRSFFDDQIAIGVRYFVKRSEDDRDRKNVLFLAIAKAVNFSKLGYFYEYFGGFQKN